MCPANLIWKVLMQQPQQNRRDILLITRSANLIFQVWPLWRGGREAGVRGDRRERREVWGIVGKTKGSACCTVEGNSTYLVITYGAKQIMKVPMKVLIFLVAL